MEERTGRAGGGRSEELGVMLDALLGTLRRAVALGANFLPDLLTTELNVDITVVKASHKCS